MCSLPEPSPVTYRALLASQFSGGWQMLRIVIHVAAGLLVSCSGLESAGDLQDWVVEGAPFTRVEVTGATRIHPQADGSIGVIFGDTRSFRLWDSEGRMVTEFLVAEGIAKALQTQSSLVIDGSSRFHFLNPYSQAVDVYDRAGRPVGTYALPDLGRPIAGMAWLPQGRMVVWTPERVLSVAPGRVAADTVSYWEWEPHTGSIHHLADVAARETAGVMIKGRTGRLAPPYSRPTRQAVFGECAIVLPGSSHGLIGVASGALGEIPPPFAGRAVTDADRRAWIEAMFAGADRAEASAAQIRSAVEAIAERLPWPESTPPSNDLLFDSMGLLWVERYEPPLGRSGLWVIVTLSGKAKARAMMPGGVGLLAAAESTVVGVRRSSGYVGLEYYRLDRLGRSLEQGSGCGQ